MDRHDLWKSTTVVLTADHGMHNGEKGIWNKWSIFDEATRVPLIISHPQSPFQGRRFKEPVELVDIYPTLQDILNLPKMTKKKCNGYTCLPLSGKSLAPVVLGNTLMGTSFPTTITAPESWDVKAAKLNAAVAPVGEEQMVTHLERAFALSQVTRCVAKNQLPAPVPSDINDNPQPGEKGDRRKKLGERKNVWGECNMDPK